MENILLDRRENVVYLTFAVYLYSDKKLIHQQHLSNV